MSDPEPFMPPRAALSRDAGHVLPRSKAKWDLLFQPIAATGVPLGGVGTGTITRASDGRFSRWTIKGGGIKQFDLPAAGFALWQAAGGGSPNAIALQPKPATGELSAFSFSPESSAWAGLFPKAWHDYRALPGAVTAECLSFSPVVPGNLEAASLPVALFRWRLTNAGETAADAAILFHFPNLSGWFADFGEARPSRPTAGSFNRLVDHDGLKGLVFDRRRVGDDLPESTGAWVIAVAESDGLEIDRTVAFDGSGDGSELWGAFAGSGRAPDLGEGWLVESGFRENAPALPTGAVSARMRLAPRQSREVTFALVWDLPVVTFGQGRRWFRAYTDQWGRDGGNATAIAAHALENTESWESAIATWHGTIRAEAGDVPHRAGMAINELYFLTAGMSIFVSAHGAPDGRRHFGLIECHDYALYDTMDLWVYAAEAVGALFPELAASVAEDYADHLTAGDMAMRRHRWHGSLFPVNLPGVCPHDLGGPGEDPFVTVNSYTYRDGTVWKDLNSDFVLCVWREGRAMGRDWRRKLFPAVRAAIEHLERNDRDGDALIENDGDPDQTFDNIPMKGPSSYCGGLWIAALLAGAALAEEADEAALAAEWRARAEKAKAAYAERLFNGEHFRVDTDGPLSEACLIEQLFGPFLARRLGLGDVVPEKMAVSALKAVFRRNVLEAGGGEGGVTLTGIPDAARAHLPHRADTSFQTAEIQPGFNFSLAAQLECWGLFDEADRLRRALHEELYVKRNLAFQTPAAFDPGAMTCRAILNMRPMAAWWLIAPRQRI